MTKHEEIITRLSPAAKAALTAVGTIRQGARLRPGVDSTVVNELGAHGLIGLGGGLSQTGTIVRQYLMDQALEF
jgi:hypothetical protein